MKKKFTYLLLLALCGFIPIACNCGKGIKDFHILSLRALTLNLKNMEADTIRFFPFDSVGKMFQVKDKVDVKRAWVDFSLTNTAYACKPDESRSVDRYSKIELIAKTDMQLDSSTDIIRAGEVISGRFVIVYGSSQQTINEFISRGGDFGIYYGPIIRLAKKPYKPTTLKFDINVQLSDNSVHTFKDEILKIRL